MRFKPSRKATTSYDATTTSPLQKCGNIGQDRDGRFSSPKLRGNEVRFWKNEFSLVQNVVKESMRTSVVLIMEWKRSGFNNGKERIGS